MNKKYFYHNFDINLVKFLEENQTLESFIKNTNYLYTEEYDPEAHYAKSLENTDLAIDTIVEFNEGVIWFYLKSTKEYDWQIKDDMKNLYSEFTKNLYKNRATIIKHISDCLTDCTKNIRLFPKLRQHLNKKGD